MHTMRSLNTIFLFIFFAMASSQKYSAKQPDALTIGEQFLNDVHIVSHGLQESEILKQKAIKDAVRALVRVKYGVLKDLKESDSKILNTLIDIVLTKLGAVKAIELAFLYTLSTRIDSLMDEIQSNDVPDLSESPIFDFVAETMIPLLWGKDNENDVQSTQNIFPPDALKPNGEWLQENIETSETRKDAEIHKNPALISTETLHEEPLLTSSKKPSIRKLMRL